MTQENVTVDSILQGARLAGFVFTEEEARELLPAIERNRRMAAAVRQLVPSTSTVEPAAVFTPVRSS